MILTEAKKRAQQEFDSVLEQTGLSFDRMRQYAMEHPSVTRSTYRIPHHDVAGTAANYVLALAKHL